jgi:NSS family neurotransmitter:Na+ symporter
MDKKRDNFGSRIGIVLATAGSAVGLGNVWRFPYMTGQNGGAAFILLYVVFILLLGIPGMVSEFIVGRYSHTNAARAYANIGRHKSWGFVGYLGILTSTIILGFYAVVAGWCLNYLGVAVTGSLKGDADSVSRYFHDFSTAALWPAVLGIVFILLTHLVIVRGVQRGIERASKVLMPVLLVLLVIIVIASCSLPGAMAGVEVLLKPDFSKITHTTMLEALGQAFFSLSLGTACLCTYASYFSPKTPLLQSASQIALMDTLIAILAGLMIFPAAFSVGVQPDSGPSLIFITLPNVFQQAFAAVPVVGRLVSIMFYALLVFAALTSTISMHEIGTAFFHEKLGLQRRYAAWIETLVCCALCVACSLSVGAADISVLGAPLMEFCDYLTAQYMLPLGALLTSILVGWVVPRHIVRSEFNAHLDSSSTPKHSSSNSQSSILHSPFSLFTVWLLAVRFVVPFGLLLIFLHQFGVL